MIQMGKTNGSCKSFIAKHLLLFSGVEKILRIHWQECMLTGFLPSKLSKSVKPPIYTVLAEQCGWGWKTCAAHI